MFNLNLQLTARRQRHTQLPLEAGAAVVTARGITKTFGDTAVLHGVDLDVPAGSLVALLGPSGCGKTTLLRTIAGLERPDAGSIWIGRRAVVDDSTMVPPERRRVGMVFQDWALFPHLSVRENVGFGLSKAERRTGRVEEILRLVELEGFADRAPATLSGGQQQRVALARALANRPSVILLDEPFSNLDASLRGQIRVEVQKVLRELGVTTIFVTHDQEEAFSVGEHVAVMFDGRIVQQARPSRLYEAPATHAVAAFIGDANFLAGDADGGTAHTSLGAVPLFDPVRGSVDVMVRPEELVIGEPVPGSVQGTVEDIEFYGHDAVYLVRCDEGRVLRSRILATPRFRPGDRVSLTYTGRRTVAFPARR